MRCSLNLHLRSAHEKPQQPNRFDSLTDPAKGEMTDHFKKAHLRLKAPKFEKNLSNTAEMKKCNDLVDFKLKPFQCEICETRFSKKDLLKRHIDGIHSELKPFQCKECNLSFPQRRRLQRHINGVHLKLRPFQCQMCRNWYSRRDEVKRHIETVHLKTKPHKRNDYRIYSNRS